jgi:predicted alpha/beta superfamily hydrolase
MIISELRIQRRIWVYLPDSYAIDSKRYPVLYMQDGQNLFDVKESFSGEWQIDEYLDTIKDAGIVVGIDNGGPSRLNEYNPNDHPDYGIGHGKAYLEILVHILKPYIDKNFRTLPDAATTAIAGSSMGGLISFYAGLYHPDVFGNVGVLSPSFWMVPDLQHQIAATLGKQHKGQRYYFYGGGREGENMVELVQDAAATMKRKGKCDVTLLVREKGVHSEESWRRVFPDFYHWLLHPAAPKRRNSKRKSK